MAPHDSKSDLPLGMTDPDGDGNYDCIPAVDNFQVISNDEGVTWGPVKNISGFLHEHRGLLPGPGTGAYLTGIDRMIFAGHFSTAEREDGRVVMYYSDNGGETFELSNSTFLRADESSVTPINEAGHLAVNLRRDVDECDLCPPKAGGCNCRGRSFSEDFGLTWTPMELGIDNFNILEFFSKKYMIYVYYSCVQK